MTSVLSVNLKKAGVPWASIWGHAPHYLQVNRNPSLTRAMLKELEPFLPRPLDLGGLDRESEEFAVQLQRALEDQGDIQGYVKRLEERYDSEERQRTSPDPAQLVRDLEDYLREQRRGRPDGDGGTK